MGEGGPGRKRRSQVTAIGAAAAREDQGTPKAGRAMIVRMKRRKAEEVGTGRGPADRRSMKDQMRIAAMIVSLIGKGTGRAGRTGRGLGATAGVMPPPMRRMYLEVKKGGANATASSAITGGKRLMVTMVVVSLQMTRNPAGGGGTADQKAVGRMRMSDVIIGQQSDLGRRAGTAGGAKEEH